MKISVFFLNTVTETCFGSSVMNNHQLLSNTYRIKDIQLSYENLKAESYPSFVYIFLCINENILAYLFEKIF